MRSGSVQVRRDVTQKEEKISGKNIKGRNFGKKEMEWLGCSKNPT